jgi:hypothetical protein
VRRNQLPKDGREHGYAQKSLSARRGLANEPRARPGPSTRVGEGSRPIYLTGANNQPSRCIWAQVFSKFRSPFLRRGQFSLEERCYGGLLRVADETAAARPPAWSARIVTVRGGPPISPSSAVSGVGLRLPIYGSGRVRSSTKHVPFANPARLRRRPLCRSPRPRPLTMRPS